MLNFKETLFEEYHPLALINLTAIANNAKKIKSMLNGKAFCAVVKSDAYGHGLIECARAVLPFCDYFAVASLQEGVNLRLAGINKPVLCLLPVKNLLRAITYNIEFAVHTPKYFLEVASLCERINKCANVHIAVNSGMNRLGLNSLEELDFILNKASKFVNISGIFSHFYNAENQEKSDKQFKAFAPFYEKLKQNNKKVIGHIASSNSLLHGEKYLMDMARIGIAIYGYSAVNGTLALEKGMKVVANKVQGRSLNKGEQLLYGDYLLEENCSLGIYAYGYANGKRACAINMFNNACMNLCAIKSEKSAVTVMDDASRFNKDYIPYEVLTSFGLNCKRIYYKNGKLQEFYT